MSDAMGRRPDGPGWYWYTGPGQWRGSIDEPVWVSPPYVECRTRHRDEIVGDMPGDFVPLTKPVADVSQLSDGYHTFAELYEHRHTLFAALMYAYAPLAFKTRRNQDGEEWPGWFIAGMETPMGQLSYHMPDEWWDRLPEIRELERNDKYDGHTSADVLQRISWLRDFFQHPDPNPFARVDADLNPPVAAPEPSWDDAPEWAMWWAVDYDGNSRWWEREPVIQRIVFVFWHSDWPSRFAGRVELPIGVDWRTTLRRRPEVGDE